MNIVYAGNCQTTAYYRLSKFLVDCEVARFSIKEIDSDAFRKCVNQSTIILHTDINSVEDAIRKNIPSAVTLIPLPVISYVGDFQDSLIYDASLLSPYGNYFHSKIVMASFLNNFSVDECCSLFTSTTYGALGYETIKEQEVTRLKNTLIPHGITAEKIDSWLSSDRFMYMPNHPMLWVLEDVIKCIFNANNIPYKDIEAKLFVDDHLRNGAIFPILSSDKKSKINLCDVPLKVKGGEIISKKEFVARSYSIYSKNEILCSPDSPLSFTCEKLLDIFESNKTGSSNISPYKSLPSYCYWRRSVSKLSPSLIDPVVSSKFTIGKNDKVATAGSCFAQHISNRLSLSGYKYYVVEQAPENVTSDEQYGVYSARYGNIYTVRQLLQLFDRAFGGFTTELNVWQRPDGKYVDPFRPQISKIGFNSEKECLLDRKKHLDSVKCMFESLDVFVFTLGLTECWEYVPDKAIVPIAPGVVAGEFNNDEYRFVNSGFLDIKKDFVEFYSKLKKINPSARIVLTVSPVPLVATYEDRHVIVSTVESKSILRAVAGEIDKSYKDVYYFPSYEIITANFSRGSYYGSDLREVLPHGVDHVMQLFKRHVLDSEESTALVEHKVLVPTQISEINNIICDEEALDD